MATKRYNFKFHCMKDKDIIDRIDSQENKQNYIRGLILSDIAADILRESIILNQDPDSESDRLYTYDEWMEKHCKAFVDDNCDDCDGCPYLDYPSLGTDEQECNAAAAYGEYVEDWKHGKLQQS